MLARTLGSTLWKRKDMVLENLVNEWITSSSFGPFMYVAYLYPVAFHISPKVADSLAIWRA